ncbi:MAG: CRISPR-associated endonuclease Cas2 [Parcubacteria group bacterium]|nr:CRISPR-associated endonuclease Cas2 [Parcubacteria group bacterium]
MILKGKSLTREILFVVAVSPILLSALFAPNAVQLLKPLIKWRKNWDKIDYKRIHEAVRRLNNKRLVRLTEKGDKLFIEITDSGKRLVKNFDYDNLELPKLKEWDKKWRLVVFDIPNKKKKERRAFSRKLKDIGFYPLQESVFIYPYDCRDEMDFICEFLSIGRYINYCIVESLDKREGDLRRIFDLELS